MKELAAKDTDFFYHGELKNYFVKEVSKVARYAVPSVVSLCKLIPTELNEGLGMYDLDEMTSETTQLGKYTVETLNEGKLMILHPKGEHTMTLIWCMGYQDMTGRIKEYFCDESMIKFPDGCRIIIPTPESRLLKEFDLEAPSWFEIPKYDHIQKDLTKLEPDHFEKDYNQE
jgi:hypothetical protein